MSTIDQKLARPNGLPAFLQRKIKFCEGVAEDKAHYTKTSYVAQAKKNDHHFETEETKTDPNAFRKPSTVLFDPKVVKGAMSWAKVYHIGPGLHNLGNTCFLNSVLQCLVYTAPFTNLLVSKLHSQKCRAEGFCVICEMERHVSVSFLKQHPNAISPNGIVANIKIIGKQFRLGRQEDAHEFLRYFIEAMQKICLSGLDPKLDVRIKETTMIHAIFGGYLQSKVTCHSCQQSSCVYDPLLDLSLEVRNANSIDMALRQFTASELLSRGNRYRCEHCKALTDATKQFRIHQAPNILTVHLKRFQMLPQGYVKIGRDIEFPADLDLTAHMTDKTVETAYSLYAVLVHEGQSCNSGHYHCFVKASNGIWYSMNDQSVHQVSLATVLKQKAYILFYQKKILIPCNSTLPLDSSEPSNKRSKVESSTTATPKKAQAPMMEPTTKQTSTKSSPIKKPKEENVSLDQDLVISKSMWHLALIPKDPRPLPNCNLSAWSIKNIS